MIERTFDYRILNRLIAWRPFITHELIYLLQDKKNVITFEHYKDGVMLHVDICKEYRGKKAVAAVMEGFDWIGKNFNIDKIYARVPKQRKDVRHFAISLGMRLTHTEKNNIFYEVQHGIRT